MYNLYKVQINFILYIKKVQEIPYSSTYWLAMNFITLQALEILESWNRQRRNVVSFKQPKFKKLSASIPRARETTNSLVR